MVVPQRSVYLIIAGGAARRSGKKTFSSVTLASPLLGSAAGLHGEQSSPVSSLSDPGEAELMLSVLR